MHCQQSDLYTIGSFWPDQHFRDKILHLHIQYYNVAPTRTGCFSINNDSSHVQWLSSLTTVAVSLTLGV